MAVIVPGPIVADIRGKCGGVTYSRNQGGLYVKANPDWVQPPSQYRDDTQAALEAVAKAWSHTLTDTERQSWKDYAAQNPRPNRWGNRNLHNGYAFYIRHNYYRWWRDNDIIHRTAPTIPPTGPLTCTITRSTTPTNYKISIPIQPFPAPNYLVLIYFSDQLPTPSGRTGTRGPWRLMEPLGLQPASLPYVDDIVPVWPIANGQHRAVKIIPQWEDDGSFASTSWSQLTT